MKVTRLGPSRPSIGLTGTFGTGPDDHVPTAHGSNVSWGSNVSVIQGNSVNVIGPIVNFADGSNTTVSVSSNTIRIHATASASASRPLMAFEPSIANWLVVVDGDGTAVMVSD